MVRTGGSSVDKHRAQFKAPLLCCRAALHTFFPNDILQRNISGLGPKGFIKANKCFRIVFLSMNEFAECAGDTLAILAHMKTKTSDDNEFLQHLFVFGCLFID